MQSVHWKVSSSWASPPSSLPAPPAPLTPRLTLFFGMTALAFSPSSVKRGDGCAKPVPDLISGPKPFKNFSSSLSLWTFVVVFRHSFGCRKLPINKSRNLFIVRPRLHTFLKLVVQVCVREHEYKFKDDQNSKICKSTLVNSEGFQMESHLQNANGEKFTAFLTQM